MPERLLAVEDVVVKFGAAEALRGVTLEIFESEAVAVLGANGAGKTTLLRAIMGLLRVASGRIVGPGGVRLDSASSHAIAKLGFCLVPEGGGVFPYLTVGENLAVGPAAVRMPKQVERTRVEEMFSRFPVLGQRRRQMAGTLSGGERQMLGIARALMVAPRALLLDEPSLGLAPRIVDSIFEIISALIAEGMSVLLIEQNARRALGVTSRAAVLERGECRLTGSSRELADNPRMIDAYLGGEQAAAVEVVEAAEALP